MNKKLLIATLSLAALAACTNDDFQVQNATSVAEESSPVQFEVINDEAQTRASMKGNKIVWSAKDGDLFTLYHGDLGGLNAFENATYKATASDGAAATLTTPSVIKPGLGIMVWPVDSDFQISNGDPLTIEIPANQSKDVENNIPYMSDFIGIAGYSPYSETLPVAMPTAYNTAGFARKYPVYMRPMASQLNLKADYAGTDATIAELYTGEDPIENIKLTSVELLTTAGGGTTDFTTEIPVQINATIPAAIQAQWDAADAYNSWVGITEFNVPGIAATGQTDKLTTECLTGNEGCKFLLLPQATMATVGQGVADAGIVVNTIYGKVVIADGVHGTLYTPAEIADAWYRYLSAIPATPADGETTATAAETSGDNAGKFKTTSKPEFGMKQTINGFSTYTATTGVVKGEPVGAAAIRYVKVLLTHLDMSDLHIKSDKQLRDAARVWQKMDLTDVTVYLDGDANDEFAISQQTIAKINEINAAVPGLTKSFKVKPCQLNASEDCATIVITGGGDVQDITFIEPNGSFKADVALNAGETWNWNGTSAANKIVKIPAAGVDEMINRGTMVNAATATLATYEASGIQNNIPFVNAKGAIWNITGGTLNVQFDVTNYGTVNIAKGAQYRQDGQVQNTVFTNEATALPTRFGGNDKNIGKVENKGVFATVQKEGYFTATINNYGLIEHADVDAKTYITNNQTVGAIFTNAFGAGNKMGRINLPYSNKNEDNVSISASLAQGFVSVTVNGEVSGALDASVVGSKVNYVIVNSGITEIKAVSSQVKYLEINQPGTELAWNVSTATTYDGLMVLSDVNVKLGTTLNVTKATYLGKDMYVGGTFTTANWDGYYGNTTANVASQYITY